VIRNLLLLLLVQQYGPSADEEDVCRPLPILMLTKFFFKTHYFSGSSPNPCAIAWKEEGKE